MKNRIPAIWFSSSALLITLLAGCGKKETEVQTSAPVTTPPVAQQVQRAATTTSSTPDARLVESRAALKARDYDQAAAALVAMQAARLNEQQAAAAAEQMRQFQSSLASGVASGDPRAIAAANRLRKASSVR
jgi:hypothetical protein